MKRLAAALLWTAFSASCLWLTAFSNEAAAKPCIHRNFNKFVGTACACNATYCDTIEPPNPVPRGQLIIYSSSMAGLRMKKSVLNFTVDGPYNNEPRYQVFINKTYQKIFGFGTAFTDAAGINLLTLKKGAQELLLRSYFSLDGIELNFGRVPIAGCDFSTHTYTYDDEEGDEVLTKFNLTAEDFNYKIPIIRRAQAMSKRPIKLLAAAWSAPPWMKTNNDYSGFGFLKPKYFQAWADYHIKFLDAYGDEGLKFWGMSTGNEPTNGIIPINRFNSLGWSPQGQRTWIAKHLGPMLRSSEHNSTKLLLLDDQRFLLPWWVKLVFSDPAARNYIDGIAVHWYWDPMFPPSLLDSTQQKYPEKFILGTEACVGDKPWETQKVILGSWSRGEMYARDIIEDLRHWVTGWIDWNFALDMQGGPNWANNFVDAPVIVNAEAGEFYKQPMFYVLGHFSKFITMGSLRVYVSRFRGVNDLEIVAFKRPDQAVVAVVFNDNEHSVPLVLRDDRRGLVKAKLPKRSIHTIIYW